MNWREIEKNSPFAYKEFELFFTKNVVFQTGDSHELMVTNDDFNLVIIHKESGHYIKRAFQNSILYDFFSSQEIECVLLMSDRGFIGFEIYSVLEKNGRDDYYFCNNVKEYFDNVISNRKQAESKMFETLFAYHEADASIIA